MLNRSSSRAVNARPESGPRRAVVIAVCGLLVLAVAAVFGQVGCCGFVNYDDDLYVYDNPHIARGLTAEGVTWIVTHPHCGNWHPLTSLSHMLDCQFYGLRPGPQHLTNVALHAGAAVLALLVLWQLTGRFWPSVCVAAVFALHPLRVESVAWIAQRKDVLSGVFFWLVLAAYVRYVGQVRSRPCSGPIGNLPHLLRYLTVVLLLVLGLLAKPMLVTVPFVLLLLDYWPLARLEPGTLLRRVIEKLPLLCLSGVSCGITLWAQREAFLPSAELTLPWRFGNALVAVVNYGKLLFYPTGLAVLYPHPGRTLSIGLAVVAGLLLAAVSFGVWFARRKRPYLLVGWCWYLGMLVPVSGLVQVGSQAAADRYTYLPQVGLVMALVWLAADVLSSRPKLAWSLGLGVLGVLAICTARQITVWRDSISLWTHTQAHAAPHPAIYNNLGNALADAGRADQAAQQYRQALELDPRDAKACSNLGNYCAGRGDFPAAIAWFRQALMLTPENAEALSNLGNALVATGQTAEAVKCYRKAVRLKPDFAEVYGNLGNVLAAQGQLDEAIASQRRALDLKPGLAESHYNLGNALLRRGDRDEALAHYREALELAQRQGKAGVADTIRARLKDLPANAR